MSLIQTVAPVPEIDLRDRRIRVPWTSSHGTGRLRSSGTVCPRGPCHPWP